MERCERGQATTGDRLGATPKVTKRTKLSVWIESKRTQPSMATPKHLKFGRRTRMARVPKRTGQEKPQEAPAQPEEEERVPQMTSFLEAVEKKYCVTSASCETIRILDDACPESTKLRRKWEGSQKSEASDDIVVDIYVPLRCTKPCFPRLIVLNNCDINRLTPNEEKLQTYLAKCACVDELDVAANSLHSWSELVAIIRVMPKLRFANLSFNQVQPHNRNVEPRPELPATDAPLDLPLWENLEILVLNGTNAPWSGVCALLECAPHLKELHLCLNRYDHVELPAGTLHTSLRRIFFNNNLVTRWSEILRFGKAFPNLEGLALMMCPLYSLVDEAEEDNAHKSNFEFGELQTLNLDGTRLHDWRDVDQLARWPKLKQIRIRGCMFHVSRKSSTEHEIRQHLIVRLPNVEILNGGGPIKAEEREAAERHFLREWTAANQKTPTTQDIDFPAHIVQRLEAKHGVLLPLADVDLRPELDIEVRCVCEHHLQIKSVNARWSVAQLKQKLESFVGLQAHEMRVRHVITEMLEVRAPEELRLPHKRLYSYNIRSGDELWIDIKPGRKVPKSYIGYIG